MGSNVDRFCRSPENPQNMLVGIWSGTSFGGFLIPMLPVGVGGLAITFGLSPLGLCRGAARAVWRTARVRPVMLDRRLSSRASRCSECAVVGWLAGGSLPLVAITAGAAMVAIAQRDPAYAIQRVEWSLLLLFASLFVVMRGFEQTGAVAWLDAHALALVGHDSVWRASIVVSAAMLALLSEPLLSNSRRHPVAQYCRESAGPAADVALVGHELDIRWHLLLIGSIS